MNKKFLNAFLLSALLTGSAVVVSCTDYDDEISDLQGQIDAQKASIQQLEALLQSGVVITDVQSTANGVTISMSNGGKYTLTNGKDGQNGQDGKDGQNGKDGVDGKNAVVWTIGEDGYWYQDGVKTDYKAIGKDGQDGSNGQGGKYYVPNAETGCFDIYQDGKKVESTTISWKAAGVSAVLDGNMLKLSGVDGTDKEVILYVGKALGSVAFIPEVISSEVPYPTTNTAFYHIWNYYDENTYIDEKSDILKQLELNKSNQVEMFYRLNPTDAYITGTNWGFINRTVTTRAMAADKSNLLNVVSATPKDGVVSVLATINPTAVSSNKEDLAALQAWYGTTPITSDYVHVTTEGIDAVLADKVATKAGSFPVMFYNRWENYQLVGLKDGEKDAFVKRFVALDAPANLGFKYDKELDLNKYVDIYSIFKYEWLAKLGFTGFSYKFSKPAEYLGNEPVGTQKTNHQWFINDDVESGIIKLNTKNLTGGPTQAIGRTPVVRVDAFATNNAGEECLIASAYIKIKISDKEMDPDLDPTDVLIGEAKELEYHAIKNPTTVIEMPWQDVNNKLYGSSGLSAETFWNNYGSGYGKYYITLTTTDKEGKNVELLKERFSIGNMNWYTGFGFQSEIFLNSNNIQTSTIKISVDPSIKTENTYKDINGKGAEYIFTITIPANDPKSYSDFVMTQKVYVKEDCKKFDYNQLYYIPTWDGVAGDYVKVKGQLNGTWEMSSYIGEHFKKIDGKDIFQYYSTINNVNTLAFAINDKDSKTVAEINADDIIKLKKAMDKAYEVVKVDYNTVLVNGEECDFTYNVIFVNPFVSGVKQGTSLYGNGIGTNTTEVAPLVIVNDNSAEVIYAWDKDAKKLVLSKKATDDYKVAEPTIEFAFKEDAAYKLITGQMSNNSKLSVDSATGVVTWYNEGTELVEDHNLTVIATVTFENLSVVKCEIPVTLLKEKK